MRTVAIYQQTENGMLRLGTFRPKDFSSVRSIAEQFRAKHPRFTGQQLFVSRRVFINGRVVDDSERIPLE